MISSPPRRSTLLLALECNPYARGQPLLDYVILNYKSSSTLGYNNARDVMYSIIDLEDDNSLKGI